MTEAVKRTEMVGVQGGTEAGASSHHPRKRSRKAKDVECYSDQPQEGGRKAEVVRPTSDQIKKRGPKIKLPPDVKEANKKARDRKRYQKMKGALQETGEMKPQLETLKNETADLAGQLRKVDSELLPAITQEMKKMKDDIEIVTNGFKKVENTIEGFAQSQLKESDWEIPLYSNHLHGKENISSEGIPNGKKLMTDSEYPLGFFDLIGGMSKEEILAEFAKTRECCEELKRGIEELKKGYEELKKKNEELKNDNEKLNSRLTAIEADKSKDANEVIKIVGDDD